MSPGGRAVRLCGSLQDITDRKRAEEALKTSSQLLSDTGEMAKVGGWELDLSTNEVSWTGEVYRVHGVEPGHKPKLEEALSFYAPEARPALEAALKKTAETGEPYALESLFMPRGSKDKIWVRSLGRAVYRGGKIVGLAGTFQNIDKYKRAEEALRESEERFRLAILATFNAVWDWNLQTDALWWNENFQVLFGYPAEEIEPGIESWKNRIHPDDLDRVTTGIHAAIDSGRQNWSDQYRFRRKDGSYAVVDDRGYIVRAANGIPVRMLGAMQDITERKRAEETLRVKDAAIESAINAIAISDLAGHLTYVNPAFLQLWGYGSSAQVVGKPVTAFWQLEEHAVEVVDALRHRGGWTGELVARRGVDGAPFDVQIAASTVVDAAGQPVCMLASFMDITARKRAAESLRESEERYRSIIEQLNDVYYRTDRDGCITMMSPSAAPLFGFPSTGEMIGRPIESLWKYPSQRAALLAAIDERGLVHDYETTAVRTDGTPFAVAVSSHYVRDASGAPDGVEGIIRDITERKQAEAALRALARHLDSVREEEHTRIARQVHDELGQALTALRLDLTWVGRKIPKGNTALRRRIDAAVALTDETITVGQRIVGELRPPILDDLGLVPAVEWYAQHFARRSGLRIELDVGAEEPVVPDHLAITAYRIVQEALTNVARHAQATHARVRLGEQDGALTIEIRDDGQGFPEEAARDPHSFGIVGMRERAASQGGELVITSSPGAGTTVRVTFPLERRKEPRAPR